MTGSIVAVLNETDIVSSYREWPEPDLALVVQCRWEQWVAPDSDVFEQRVIPDGCSDVIVFAGGSAVVVGPTMDVALPKLLPGTHLRGLRLRTEAVAAGLRYPGTELRDSVLPLNAVVPNRVALEIAETIWDRPG